MSTTGKKKKARMSRGQEMCSDKENLDIILGGNHFNREESEDSILARRPESVNSNASEKNLHLNTKENRSGNSADLGQNSTVASSSAEFRDYRVN